MSVAVGDRVKYARMHDEWGKGEVRAVWPDGKVTIMFAKGGERKLPKGTDLEKLEGDGASDEILDRPRARKSVAAKKSPRSTPPFEHLKQDFLRRFPGGFDDPDFVARERDFKMDAHRKLLETLGRSALADLFEHGEFQAVCARARAVKISIIDHHETMALDKSTKDTAGAELFARGLNELLYASGEFRPRFEQFTDVLERLGGAKWPIATYYAFIAFPSEHMFLKPAATKEVAESLGLELRYRPQPNWQTYEALLELAAVLEERLADLNPKDRIDLQSFVWFLSKRDVYAKRSDSSVIARLDEEGK
jgi:hypothetical protein